MVFQDSQKLLTLIEKVMSRSRDYYSFDAEMLQPNESQPEEILLIDKISGLLENFWKMTKEDRETLMDLIRRNVDE